MCARHRDRPSPPAGKTRGWADRIHRRGATRRRTVYFPSRRRHWPLPLVRRRALTDADSLGATPQAVRQTIVRSAERAAVILARSSWWRHKGFPRGAHPRKRWRGSRKSCAILGENRVTGTLPKMTRSALPQPSTGCIWDRTHLQTKRSSSSSIASGWSQSLDSVGLAGARPPDIASPLDVLIEVTSRKNHRRLGVSPADLPRVARAVNRPDALRAPGLMTVAPMVEGSGTIPTVFRRLRRPARPTIITTRRRTAGPFPVGMTDDYAVAVEEGATMLRLAARSIPDRDEFPQCRTAIIPAHLARS